MLAHCAGRICKRSRRSWWAVTRVWRWMCSVRRCAKGAENGQTEQIAGRLASCSEARYIGIMPSELGGSRRRGRLFGCEWD